MNAAESSVESTRKLFLLTEGLYRRNAIGNDACRNFSSFGEDEDLIRRPPPVAKSGLICTLR